MIIDGRSIAKKVEERLRGSFAKLTKNDKSPVVSFLTFGEDMATQSFLAIKKKVAERVGVDLQIVALPEEVVPEVAERVLTAIIEGESVGVVVQLPLPKSFSRDDFLALIPQGKDIDCLSSLTLEKFASGERVFAPPVALAVAEIFAEEKIDFLNKKIAVVGHGFLVGKPVAAWLENNGVDFEVFDIDSDLSQLRGFDVVISGVGKPGIITGEMVKDGVVLIDAGTSEVDGRVSGDIAESAREKSALHTPVPGGVGPITVVKLFENVLRVVEGNSSAQKINDL